MTNMYNQSNILNWQPLNFRDLSSSKRSQLSKEKPVKTIDIPESEPHPVIVAVDPAVVEQDLQQLKEQIKAQAYQEGFDLGKQQGLIDGNQIGYEQGFQLGQQEGRQHIEQQLNVEKNNAAQAITHLMSNFEQSLYDIDELIVPKLFDLALLAAQKTVGSISKVKQKQLVHTIKTLIEQCALLSEPLLLHLNPDDLVWLEPLLGEQIKQDNWQLIADPNIETGNCKLLSDNNEIDASCTNHWQIMADCVHGESD